MEARTRARELRNNATEPERRLWAQLGARKVAGVRFNRQVVIGPYIIDFAARTPKLAIEVDGETHAQADQYDDNRTAYLTALGWHIVRFSNADVMHNLEGVVSRIVTSLAALPSPDPSRKREGS